MLFRKTAEPTLFQSPSKFFLILSVGFLSACASAPPFQEYTIAKAAITAARDVDSAKFAAPLWNRADEYYRKGEKAYNNSDYEVSKRQFILATEYAERAENVTRLKKFQGGDTFP